MPDFRGFVHVQKARFAGLTRTPVWPTMPSVYLFWRKGIRMQKMIALCLIALTVFAASGCALIGRHSAPIEGGRQTTVGLLSINGMGDGFPMIPLYSRTDMGK